MERVKYNYKTKEIKCQVGAQEIYGVAYTSDIRKNTSRHLRP